MFENLFEMWLEGVKIIISFAPTLICLIGLPILIFVVVDVVCSMMTKELYGGFIELDISKYLLPKCIHKFLLELLNR